MTKDLNPKFDIPVALFTFKRVDTLERIIDVFRNANISKLYLFSDGPRNEEEGKLVSLTREKVLEMIDWDCEVIKKFSNTNQGVFNQIGMGALEVFKTEERVIFVEDDNLPDITFFNYCKYMLNKYRDDEKVLWVCGTNYESESKYLESDYVFTKHMLPCGWASWSHKFPKYYLTSFSILNDHKNRKIVWKSYESKQLYCQQIRNFKCEKYREDHDRRFASWDFHMALSIRYYGLFGIAPKYNLIRNIGVDEFSTHGGKSLNRPNTSKFCEIPTHSFPNDPIAPSKEEINKEFEKNTTKIILAPLYIRLLFPFITFLKKLLRIYPDKSFTSLFYR